MSKQRILVLQGGVSDEREVSLRSAANVVRRLQSLGYDVRVDDPARDGFNLRAAAHDIDLVLPILHGAGGEDGALQAQLEQIGVSYLGSDAAACALTYGKDKYRDFVAKNNILIANGRVVTQDEFYASELTKSPYVVKPITGGSSIDTLIVRDPTSVATEQLQTIFAKHSQMLLEELIEGQELTVGILGEEALPVIGITPPQDEEFDYENKYNGKTAEVVDPLEISAEAKRRAQDLALRVHKLTGCRHLSRTDMILTPAGELYVLETNTIPGMTEQSLFPKMAAAAGYSMSQLAERFVQLAIAK